ncbi:MAG: hypothetical protein BHV69_10130 [Bacteroidales bacterium 52_46]|nr:MAG: hypothetical protein BHV69_10130 [Bacteroidales bacterium 52_46]
MRNPIKEIVDYLRADNAMDELERAIKAEERQLAEYRRLRRRLPRLISELESTVNELKKLLR